MALYLVQHGKSLPGEQDPKKGLSPTGAVEVKRIAEVARGYGVRVRRIEHSGKERARQTADLMAEALQPEQSPIARPGLAPLDEVEPVAAGLDPGEALMLVGHLPFMERLTSQLILGRREPLVFKFQNGGIVCLDRDPHGRQWFIKWALMPRIG